MANLTLRTSTGNSGDTIKSTPLTYAEMDLNFINLDNEISELKTADGSSLIGYLPSGENAVDTTVQDKLRRQISVIDFGADPTGVTDSAPAIRAAIAHGYTVFRSGNSGGVFGGVTGDGSYYVASIPVIFFPAGVYRVDSVLTPTGVNWHHFEGERSILVLAPGVTAFEGVANNVNFSGLTFRAGECAISIKTGNADGIRINVDDCEFHEQTQSMIRSDNNSASTILNISRCKFIQTTAAVRNAYIFEFLSMDMVNVDGCWMTAHGFNMAAFYAHVVLFNMSNCLLVPGGDYDNVEIRPASFAWTGRWFDWYGAALRLKNVRFGGEDGGAPIVYNYTNIKDHGEFPWVSYSIVMDSCEIPCNIVSNRADAGVIVAKTGLPAMIRIVGCRGKVDAPYIKDEMTSETMLSYLTKYQQGIKWNRDLNVYEEFVVEYPPFTIEIANNNDRGYMLTDESATTKILGNYARFVVPTQNGVTEYLPKIESKVIQGDSYTQTSVEANTSIVDTGIVSTTPIIGYNKSAVYDIIVSGNPNVSGSADYRHTQIGVIILGTGFSGTAETNISYTKIANSENTVIPGSLTVTAVFWNGTTESVVATVGSTTHQIRIKIAGYTGAIGSGQGVRLVKRY